MGILDDSLKIIALLKKNGMMSAAELSTELGKQKRQITRYINLLKKHGYNIVSVLGTNGGYRLEEVYLSNDEELALYKAEKLLEQLDFEHLDDFKSALQKINYKFKIDDMR